jgi:hypothetical protein
VNLKQRFEFETVDKLSQLKEYDIEGIARQPETEI